MEKHQTKIGKNLIEILMYSMYDDAKVVLREYVQNAYDAINEAVDLGILEAAKYGYVNIILDNRHRSVHINDNGTGIVKKFAAKKLLDIADSFKDGKNTAGHYGIGRLTGLQFCERLIFRTSAKGEDEYTEVVFDSNMARMILNDTNDHRNAEEVVNSIATVTFGPEEIDKHYFEIEMENIRKDYSQLLDEDSVREYLEEVAPIDYSTQFKNLLINRAEIPPHIKSQRDNLKYIQLSINNLVDIRKRYGLEIEGTGDKIQTLHYFDIIDDEYGLLAWGWFAITAFTKAIPIKDLNRGIRLRKKNIQVGTSNLLDKYFDESRGNNYFYGEVFAIRKTIRDHEEQIGKIADIVYAPQKVENEGNESATDSTTEEAAAEDNKPAERDRSERAPYPEEVRKMAEDLIKAEYGKSSYRVMSNLLQIPATTVKRWTKKLIEKGEIAKQ